MRSVVKRFGDTVAVDRVDFTAFPGSVHALLGENGAGKSTLMRIAFGMAGADAGTVELFGESMRVHSVRRARLAGVGMVHQHHSFVPGLTAIENLMLGGRGVFRPAEARDLLQRTSTSAGLAVPPDSLVRELSIVQQQRLEILKALSRGARLLILDEPTALLAPAEIEELLRWITGYARDGGSVVLVTHKLREALAVADTVTVLRRGRVAYTGRVSESSEEQLSRAIFGDATPLESASPAAPAVTGPVAVEARGIEIVSETRRRVVRIRGASFTLRRHELVGIAAIEGSGHRELLAAIAGLQPVTSGELQLPERIAVIPADRLRDGLIPEFTLTENVGLHELGRRRGLMPWAELAARTRTLIRQFGIVAPSARTVAAALSGGNQQRLVVARELDRETDLVVAENPTRGLDMRATAFVHARLRDAAAAGAAVVLYSSDLDELLSLATRVLVVHHGELREAALDRDAIGRAILGAA